MTLLFSYLFGVLGSVFSVNNIFFQKPDTSEQEANNNGAPSFEAVPISPTSSDPPESAKDDDTVEHVSDQLQQSSTSSAERLPIVEAVKSLEQIDESAQDPDEASLNLAEPPQQTTTSTTAPLQTMEEIAPQQPSSVMAEFSNDAIKNSTIDTGSPIEVVSGRVTTLEPFGDNIESVQVLEGPAYGNLTVNSDNTLALVLTETDHVGQMAISYLVTQTDGSTQTVNTKLNAVKDAVSGGWGTGDHYMLETDANGDLIVEWGENHRDVYISGSEKALSIADIAAIEGIAVDKVSRWWLESHPEYGGSEEMALDEDAGYLLWEFLVRESNQTKPSSNWLRFEAGYEYEFGPNTLSGLRGESELHPTHITSYGDGPKPIITNQVFSVAEGAENVVISNLEFDAGVQFLAGKNVIFDNITSNAKFVTQFASQVTLRNSSLTDVHHETSKSDDYWEPFANRVSGMYAGSVDGLLIENNFFDHNGWADDYDPDLSLESSMPPSILNHNAYIAASNLDVTFRDNISMRASSYGAQIRSGGLVEDNAFIDNNAGFYVAGGTDRQDTREIGPNKEFPGNYSLVSDNLVTSGQDLRYGPINGWRAAGIENLAPSTSLVDNIVTHLADPNNPDEQDAKTKADFAVEHQHTAYTDDTIVYNWASAHEAADVRDQNVEGLDTNVLDETTIQNYAAQILSDPDATIADLADHLEALAEQGYVDADQIIDFFQSGFGISLGNRLTPEILRFSPSDLGEGLRWDNRLNWSTEDLPGTVAGDSVDLAGNWVKYGGTSTIQDLALGDGGRLTITQGRLAVDGEIIIDGNDSSLTLDAAGQLWIDSYSDNDLLNVTIDGGRFANTGQITGRMDMDVRDGQAILATSDAAFEIGRGGRLDIFGSDANVGFDGINDDIGVLRMQVGGTLSFAAEDSLFGTIQEFRSGLYGSENSDIATGMNLGGGTLDLNLSAPELDLGSKHTLVDVDELVGMFSRINVTGLDENRDAKLLVDYDSDIIQIQILGSGTANFSYEVIGNQSSAQSDSALWDALTLGQPVLTEDTMLIEIYVNEELIE